MVRAQKVKGLSWTVDLEGDELANSIDAVKNPVSI